MGSTIYHWKKMQLYHYQGEAELKIAGAQSSIHPLVSYQVYLLRVRVRRLL